MIKFKRTAVVALLAMGSTAQAGMLYNITDLGALGADHGYGPMSINASGQVTGTYSTAGGGPRAFITNSSGQMVDLFPSSTTASYGNGINASGQVTGYANGGAFVTNSSGQISYLGTLPGGGESIGHAINDSGQVAGQSYISHNSYPAIDTSSSWHAFVTNSSGQITDLGANAIGMAINDSGQVAGYSGYGGSQAFITNSSGQKIGVGSLGGFGSGAYGINASGQVTGYADTAYQHGNSEMHAFISDSSAQMVDLGTLGGTQSWGYGINDVGQVTGFSTTSNADQHAFITDNGIMIDLNSLLVSSAIGWTLQVGYGINDSGQITGSGIHNGLRQAYVLTPVPEPSIIWLFGSGLVLLAFTHRRKNQNIQLQYC